MRPLRRKRPPVPAVRLRPANLVAQLADVRAFMEEHAEWSRERHADLIHLRDMYGPEIWPDDPDVHAERAEAVAVLDEYYALL